MSPHLRNQRREQGSILLITLLTVVILGATLSSYLVMVGAQKTSVSRSQAWNGAMALAEAGVEEALAQLNPGATLQVINRSANGWGLPAGGCYGPVSRNLTNGSYSITYTDDKYPIIYSTGCVAVANGGGTVSRALKVTTTLVPLFNAALAAQDGITLMGNDIRTDSFNSLDPNLSDNGRYVSSKTSTNGDVATLYGILDIGNANICGDVLLGPTATDTMLKNALVTGTVANDFNYNFEAVVLPTASWLIPASTNQVIDGVTYKHVFLNSGDFALPGFTGSLYVAPGAKVRLYITDNAYPDCIRVAASAGVSGKLEIFMGGAVFRLSGQDTVDCGLAANVSYYGLPGNTQIAFTGNASWTGTIYAPNADFNSLGGGGVDTYDFVGACVTKTMKINGHYNFHYDESLKQTGPLRGYVAASWREL